MSKLWTPVRGWHWTIGDWRARVADPLDAELIGLRSVITALVPESEGTVSKAILDVHSGSPVEASSGARGPSAGGWSDQA